MVVLSKQQDRLIWSSGQRSSQQRRIVATSKVRRKAGEVSVSTNMGSLTIDVC